MNKLVLAMAIVSAVAIAGCEDDPHDLDFTRKDAAAGGSKHDAGRDAGHGGTGAVGAAGASGAAGTAGAGGAAGAAGGSAGMAGADAGPGADAGQ